MVTGGIPAVDVVLNCQLPAAFRPCAGPPEGGLELGRDVFCPPPPHPKSRTRVDSSHEVLDKCFMDLPPSWIVGVLGPMGEERRYAEWLVVSQLSSAGPVFLVELRDSGSARSCVAQILTSAWTPSGFFSTERWLDGRSPTSAVQPPIPLPASCSPSPLRFPGGSSGSDGPSSFLPPKPG